ncbi:zinc finger CCCH domain-containing protein 14 [Phtheirospermum japonicum]|uniref:Zinc finger CCCH domain-containing protein 14 n=1 Tax=Phtheirospermum japonicum TaxID=374723 RepID=A0A830CQN4_9LAMI|nr:zinc finger CCCH domain-containing protein 14 [Phtheirospermum japonicum]
MDFGRKRSRPDAAFSGNGGFKKPKDELDSFTTGVGSKSKPCTKFFSTSGCSFGDTCHFQHYSPGYNAHTQLANSLGGNNNTSIPVARNTAFTDGPGPTMKSKLCNKINTPEGCRYGDKCRFAHSEMEFSSSKPRSNNPGGYEEQCTMMGPTVGFSQRFESTQHGLPAGNFGVSATAKISVDASFAGPIIGKNGNNSKQICRQTGVRLSIKDHETDPNMRNIELEGSFDQIKEASSMVHELIMNISAASGRVEQNTGSLGRGVPQSNYQKKKMCEKFPKGLCTFGERCRFAHSSVS